MTTAPQYTVVETMPHALRASHEDAGNRGAYPHNGAIRVVMDYRDAFEDEWTHVVGWASDDDLDTLEMVVDVTRWTP